MFKKLFMRHINFIWPALFFVILLKYAYYGYSYYPVLDDNNMYGFFRLFDNTFRDVLLGFRMYTTRPIAVFLDAYFWTMLWDVPGLALFIITVLHFLTCVFVYKVLEKRGVNTGLTAIAVFALLPLGSEGTYWLSASTRTVVGLFFLALSVYLLSLYLENEAVPKRKYIFLALFFITHLVSLGFYEQVIALSFFALPLWFAASWKQLKSKWIIVLPLFNFMAIAFWYKTFSGEGNMASRGQLVSGHYLYHTKEVVKAIRDVWKKGFINLYHAGFPKGLQTLISDGSFIFLLLMGAACAALFLLLRKEKFNSSVKSNALKFLLGLLLFAVPYAPFFAMQLIWICGRNIFLSFIGLGLMLEAVLDAASRGRLLVIGRSLIVSLLVFIFLTANVQELTYYRSLGVIDREITSSISNIPEASEYLKGNKTLILFNTRPTYVETLAKGLENCTSSDWALAGAISAHTGIRRIREAYPVAEGVFLRLDRNSVKASVLLGMDEARNVFPLTIARETEDRLYLSTTGGEDFGRLEFQQDGSTVYHKQELIP